MKLLVKRAEFDVSPRDFFCKWHECIDEQGKTHRVDLYVNGDFPDDSPYVENPRLLIGKTVEVDYLHPYQEIAMNVKVPA